MVLPGVELPMLFEPRDNDRPGLTNPDARSDVGVRGSDIESPLLGDVGTSGAKDGVDFS